MYFLYASKPGTPRKLVATFDSEQQLLAYVGWATLKKNSDGTSKFEQGSALAGYRRWEPSAAPLDRGGRRPRAAQSVAQHVVGRRAQLRCRGFADNNFMPLLTGAASHCAVGTI